MGSRQNNPGNIPIGFSRDDLLEGIGAVSRDDAVGAVIGMEDLLRFGLVKVIERAIVSGTSPMVRLPFDFKVLFVQLIVGVTGTSGNTTLDMDIDGTDVAGNPLITVPFSEPDKVIADSSQLDIDVKAGEEVGVELAPATGASQIFIYIWLQRTGRDGGIGIPI